MEAFTQLSTEIVVETFMESSTTNSVFHPRCSLPHIARSNFLCKTATGMNYAVRAVHVLLLLERVQNSGCIGR